MNGCKFAQLIRENEISNRLHLRRRFLEQARDLLYGGATRGAIKRIIDVLSGMQDNDEAVVGLHRECARMVELVHAAIAASDTLRPPPLPLKERDCVACDLGSESAGMCDLSHTCGVRS